MTPHSRLGRVSTWLGRLSIVAVLLGPLLAHFELVRPVAGFGVFAVGVLLALLCALLGIIALLAGPAGTRGATAAGLLPAALVVLTVLVASGGGSAPRINDISTDTVNPPVFVHALTLPENAGHDMAYPGESFASQQREGYGAIDAVTLASPPDEAFRRVAAAARGVDGWVITREDPAARALEGYEVSSLFRFKDDFVIVVREANGHSAVHMRSKSRDGQGDMGVNAKRIRTFLAQVKE